MRTPLIAVVASALGIACAAPPAASAPAVESEVREAPSLAFGFPDEEGVGAQSLIDLTQFIAGGTRRVFSVLISKHGRVVYELYTSSLGRDHAHYVMSVTKSFTSALVGAAIGQGLVKSAEESVADALPAELFPDEAARDRFRTVTIRDVLGMSALDAQVPPHRSLPEDVVRGRDFFASPNRTAFALTQSLLPSPGASFQYTDITPLLATGIVSYAAKSTALDYANRVLFGPMGFEHQEWMHEDAAGLDNGAYGLRVRPIDMQKFGLLYANEGRWNGTQLLPAEWVRTSFTPWIKSKPTQPSPNYGWYWWTFDYGPGWTARVADGWKGQRIAVIPEQDVVVTMTGCITDDENGFFAQIIHDYVIPAVTGRPDPTLRQPLLDALEHVRTGPPRFAGVEARMIPSIAAKETHHGFSP